MTPNPSDPEWSAWATFANDVSRAVNGTDWMPLSGRTKVAALLWEQGYRPTLEQIEAEREHQRQATVDPPRCPYPVRDDGICSHHHDNVCGGATPTSCATCLACMYTEVARLGSIKSDIVCVPCEEHRP